MWTYLMPQNYTLQNGKNVNFYVMYILSQNIISQKKKKKSQNF